MSSANTPSEPEPVDAAAAAPEAPVATPATARAEEPSEQVLIRESAVRLRRAPKYSAFIIVGAGIGAIVTFILTAIFPVDPVVGFSALFGYFALFGVTGGALLGAVLALILDRVTERRARDARAEQTTVEPGPIEGTLED